MIVLEGDSGMTHEVVIHGVTEAESLHET